MIIQRVNSNGELHVLLTLVVKLFPLVSQELSACRIYDALVVMTNNTIKQHTQMREELQNRHQDITNCESICKTMMLYFCCFLSYLYADLSQPSIFGRQLACPTSLEYKSLMFCQEQKDRTTKFFLSKHIRCFRSSTRRRRWRRTLLTEC